MNQPVVSIVLPVYNAEKYLHQCIESLLDQGDNNLEIIVIDDGSTDHSGAICQMYSEKDARIRYFRQNNMGVSAARNLGLQHASGEFVTFVDADDMLRPDAIDSMLAAAHGSTDLVIGSYERFRCGAGQEVINSGQEFSFNDIRTDFAELDKLIDFPWGKLFRRNVILENNLAFDKNIPYGEDHIFNIAFCCYAKSVNVISDVVYRYRLGGVASSVKYHKNMHQLSYAMLQAYENYSRKMANFPVKYLQEKIKDQLYGTIMHYISHCSFREADSRIEETLEIFDCYIDENYIVPEFYSSDMRDSILVRDPKRILHCFFKRNWKRIMLKRAKLICYRAFSRGK